MKAERRSMKQMCKVVKAARPLIKPMKAGVVKVAQPPMKPIKDKGFPAFEGAGRLKKRSHWPIKAIHKYIKWRLRHGRDCFVRVQTYKMLNSLKLQIRHVL